jgi:hypothetical protein
MAINGLKQASDQNVLTIRQELAKVGLLVSADPNSARNVRLRRLIEDPKRYELGDVIGILSDLPEEEAPDLDLEPEQDQDQAPEPRDDTVAVIIWAGTQLTTFQIERLRNVYTTLDGLVRHGATDALAATLYNSVILDRDPVVNQQMKTFMGGVEAVHQALDQELSHAEATRQCFAKLSDIAARVLVYRPANPCFIRLDLQHLPGTWSTYGVNDNDPLILPPLEQGKKIILVTIGHGGPGGHTSFPGRGLKSQPEIADLLGPVSLRDTTLRIPLQCYPQQAVATWAGQGGAVSIDNDDRSDDLEMATWIQDKLTPAIRHWLAKF